MLGAPSLLNDSLAEITKPLTFYEVTVQSDHFVDPSVHYNDDNTTTIHSNDVFQRLQGEEDRTGGGFTIPHTAPDVKAF